MSDPLAKLHIDLPITYDRDRYLYLVTCSCGEPFYGYNPDEALSAQLEHVEEELPDQDDEVATFTDVSTWQAARRAAQRLGVRGTVTPSQVQDAITDLMWLAHVGIDSPISNAPSVASRAASMWGREWADNLDFKKR